MRLIDADELIKRMRKWMPKDPCGREQTVEEVVATDIAVSVFMEIEETPTAFDKEKVIEELKSAIGDIHYTEDASFNGKCIEDFEFIQAKTALELVEKGGIE